MGLLDELAQNLDAPPPVSEQGYDWNPNNLGEYRGANLDQWHQFTNADVRAEIALHPDMISSYSFPGDPRVNAFYAGLPLDSYTGMDTAQVNTVGGASDAMQQMMAAIPDAGRGSPLGGATTFMQHYGPDNVPAAVHEGAALPTTNNWQLLPPPYNRPGFQMRNGHIIDTRSAGYKAGYAAYMDPNGFHPGEGSNSSVSGVYSPHISVAGYPAGFGLQGQHFGWPGQIEEWGSYPFNLP